MPFHRPSTKTAALSALDLMGTVQGRIRPIRYLRPNLNNLLVSAGFRLNDTDIQRVRGVGICTHAICLEFIGNLLAPMFLFPIQRNVLYLPPDFSLTFWF